MPDFSLDAEDAPPADGEPEPEGEGDYSNMPAPDGLPEADAQGDPEDSGQEDEDPTAETNVRTNVMNLSKLDRMLAKQHVYRLFRGLIDSVETALGTIDKNEAIIDPDVRNPAITAFNTVQTQLKTYLSTKFSLVNYEEAVEIYMIFAARVNELVTTVHDATKKKLKHGNASVSGDNDLIARYEDNGTGAQ